MAISEQYLSIINQKIFNEPNGNQYSKKFGDMYNIIMDFMKDNNIMNEQYLNFMVPTESFYSVLTQTFYCCLLTFKGSPQQQTIARQYLINIKNNINIEHENEQPPGFFGGFFTSLVQVFSGNNTEITNNGNGMYYHINDVIDKYYDETNGIDFSNMYKLLNEFMNCNDHFHEEYMFVLTFGVHVFVESISSLPNKKNLFQNYLLNLKEFNKIYDKYALYDEPNFRGPIYF